MEPRRIEITETRLGFNIQELIGEQEGRLTYQANKHDLIRRISQIAEEWEKSADDPPQAEN